ncbi:MAG TPA: hypothetical protein VJM15_09270 [Sphingomicrobium sp.]|nr:hypothetical protein [Sphingomicrobium sp.]
MVVGLLLLAAASPSTEALALGRRIAEQGALASLLPQIQQKETDELVAAYPELSAADQAKLRATATRIYQAGRDRLMAAEGRAWAERLTTAEMRAIIAYQDSAAGKRHRAVAPEVIAATLASVGEIDFKNDVRAAYCEETGKLCPN